jgi:cell pole-organizing protein PopZ
MSGAAPLRDDRRGAEPGALAVSMEEILVSIRRILADGQGVWGGAQGSFVGPETMEPNGGSLRFDAAPGAARSRGCSEPRAAKDLAARGSVASPRTTIGRPAAQLAATVAETSAAAAFRALVASRFVQDSDLVADLTREMIRPLLVAWLDEHLPALVERLVAAEIARIAGGE